MPSLIASLYSLTMVFGLALALGVPGYGQVPNDNVAGKIELGVNQAPYASTSAGCTVEWGCVDESATGKCIEYHNDQWFGFTPRRPGTYFVNVSRQSCRDIRGVQLVVIDGLPCQPATYQVLSCTSLATQDDIFVAMENLTAHRTYLLNIDGYLNDFCRFSVQVSTRSRGFPARNIGLKTAPDLETGNPAVRLEWTVIDSVAAYLNTYSVYRRHEKEKKSQLRGMVRHETNTRGESVLSYTLVDTLADKGRYTYEIMGLRNDSTTVWITERSVEYKPTSFRPEDYLILKQQYALNTPLTLLLFDAKTGRLLRRSSLVFQRKGRPWQYFVGDWRNQGIYKFKLKIVDNLRNKSQEFLMDTGVPK